MFSRHAINSILLGLVAIALLLAGRGVFNLVIQSSRQPPVALENVHLSAGDSPGTIHLETDTEFSGEDLHAVLLPMAPDEKLLPGPLRVWQDLLSRSAKQMSGAVSQGFSGIQLWDKAPGSLLAPVFSTHLPGHPLDVAIDGEQAFLLCNGGTWTLIDFSAWQQPELYNLTPAGHYVVSMSISGQRAWLLMDDGQLLVMDITVPRRPREVMRYQLERGTASIAVRGEHLFSYVLSQEQSSKSIVVRKITSDSSLVDVGRTPLPGVRKNGVWGNDRLFLPLLYGGVAVYDLTAPDRVEQSETIHVDDLISRIALQDESLYLLGKRHRLYKVALDEEPRRAQMLAENGNHYAMLLLRKDFIAAFSLVKGLQVYDRGPLDLRFAAGKSFVWYPQGVLLSSRGSGKSLLVMNADGPDMGGRVVSNDSLEVVGLPVGGAILSAAWFGKDLLILDEQGHLSRYAKNDQGHWKQVEKLIFNRQLRWLAVHGQRAFLGGAATLYILDDNHHGLKGMRQISLAAEKTWMALAYDQTLMIAAGRDGLLMLDLSSSEAMSEVTSLQLPWLVRKQVDLRDLSISGNRLIGAAGTVGVLAVRLDGPQGVDLIGVLPLPGNVDSVVQSGATFLAAAEHAVYVGWSDDDFLQEVGRMEFAGASHLIQIDKGHWAGYSAGRGWTLLPLPQVSSGFTQRSPRQGQVEFSMVPDDWSYHLNLFNGYGLFSAPDVLTLSSRNVTAP